MYDKITTKVNATNTSGFVLNKILINQELRRKLMTLAKKIPDTSGLVKKTDYNAEISEIESKMPTIIALVLLLHKL